MTPLLPSLLVACATNFVVAAAVEDDASLVQWRLKTNTLIAKGRTNRSGEGCTCGPEDDQWDDHCLCHVEKTCVWDKTARECTREETGPADEKVPDDASKDYGRTGKGVSGMPHRIVGLFPVVAQNSLEKKSKKEKSGEDGPGDHACWAVTRAVNSKWAGILDKQGPKAYANELYTGHTGWFIPTKGTCPLTEHTQRVFLNDAAKFTKDTVGNWVQHHIAKGRTIAAAMGKKTCAGTFHYVTIIGTMPSPAKQATNEILVMDPWCPEYGDGPGYYTTKNVISLGRYDNGKVEHSAMTHPCIRVSKIHDFQIRTGSETVGMMMLDNLNYASDPDPRCTFKMWLVCHKTANKNCPDDWDGR